MMNNLPEPKWDRPPVSNKKVNMDDKLLSLKEQFCNYYCPSKSKIIDYRCSGTIECVECENTIECNQIQEIYFDFCEECKISDYIVFIRDEL